MWAYLSDVRPKDLLILHHFFFSEGGGGGGGSFFGSLRMTGRLGAPNVLLGFGC